MPTLLLESLRLLVSIESERTKLLILIQNTIKVYFMCFNESMILQENMIIDILIFFIVNRGLRLIYLIIFPKATFILEPTFINS